MHGRDTVYVAHGAAGDAGREVFSGMRVTFPQWSPVEDKLSLWFTFTPMYRSALSLIVGGGLLRGDPAALFEPGSGQVTWLAVSPHEKAQVGHYYLLKRDYATAWQWYEDAGRDWPPPKPGDAGLDPFWARELAQPHDIKFFQYYCLSKLGRKEDARAKLDEFRKTFPRRPDKPQGQNLPPEEAWLRDLLDADGLVAPLVRDFYCAEVFLSLDAGADAETYFLDTLKTAPTDAARMSSAIVLAQIVLLADRPQEYADLTTDTVVPQLLKVVKARPAATAANPLDIETATQTVGQFALLPLISPKFLAALPEGKVRALAERLEAVRPKAESDFGRLEIDLTLRAAYARLKMDNKRQEAERRLQDNPTTTLVPRSPGEIDQFIDTTRGLLTGLLQPR
jgi:hypothetical protein